MIFKTVFKRVDVKGGCEGWRVEVEVKGAGGGVYLQAKASISGRYLQVPW